MSPYNHILDNGITTTLQPPALLAAMLKTPEEMMALHTRLKLSGYERDMALFVVNHRKDAEKKGKYKFFVFTKNPGTGVKMDK